MGCERLEKVQESRGQLLTTDIPISTRTLPTPWSAVRFFYRTLWSSLAMDQCQMFGCSRREHSENFPTKKTAHHRQINRKHEHTSSPLTQQTPLHNRDQNITNKWCFGVFPFSELIVLSLHSIHCILIIGLLYGSVLFSNHVKNCYLFHKLIVRFNLQCGSLLGRLSNNPMRL